MDVQVKVEPSWEDCDSESDAATQAELYTGHEIKQEVVVGPETIQRPDISLSMIVAERKGAQTEIKKAPCSCNRCNIQKDFTCDYCLNEHYCKICKEHFEHKYQLKKHMSTHFSQQVLSYSCTICDKQFKHKSSLDSHKWVHVTTRPYSCKFCNKSFKLKGALTTHERKHTGNKPYTCEICYREFTQQTSLNNHILLHKGIKPFPCPNCSQQFTQISNLRKHLIKHSKDTNDDVGTSDFFSEYEDMDIVRPVGLPYKSSKCAS